MGLPYSNQRMIKNQAEHATCLPRRLIAGSHCGGPGSRTGQIMWDLLWAEWQWGRFSVSTSFSPANSYSTRCSTVTIICHLGLIKLDHSVTAGPSGLGLTPWEKNNTTALMLLSCLSYYSTLQMVATHSSKTSVTKQCVIRRYIRIERITFH